jgi:Txe/YoeB family toxin of Txe-Axe toxin-antitoxin module
VSWELVFTSPARKDAKKLASSGLKPQTERILALLARNPYETPPPFEKLVGNFPEPFPGESTSGIGLFIRSLTK